MFCPGWCIHIITFALLFCHNALVCLCGIWAVLGFDIFQWLIYISAMALPLQLPLALTLLSSGLFLALHLILWGVFFWRDTQWTLMSPCAGVFAQLWNSALLVWKMFALFFLCVWSWQGLQGIGYSGAGWSPGHSALFAWGMKTVFTGPGNSFGLWCAPRGPLFLHE